jgi:hypothetical protein
MKRPQPAVTLSQYGRPVPNDWPLKVPAKWMIAGKARDHWYIDHLGTAPVFRGKGACEKAIAKLYRQHGHTVTPGQCRYALRAQARRSKETRRRFIIAVYMDSRRAQS